jgi:hypothetical protein
MSLQSWLRALDFSPNEAHEIVIVGNPGDPDTRSLLREVHRRLLHGTVLAVIAPDTPSGERGMADAGGMSPDGRQSHSLRLPEKIV